MSNETELKSRDYSIPASLMAELLEVVENAQSDVNGLVPDAIALHAKLQLIVELKDRDIPKENPTKPAEYAGDKVFKEIQEKQKKFEEAIKKFEEERRAQEKLGPRPLNPPSWPDSFPRPHDPFVDPYRITCIGASVDSNSVSKAQQELINRCQATAQNRQEVATSGYMRHDAVDLRTGLAVSPAGSPQAQAESI